MSYREYVRLTRMDYVKRLYTNMHGLIPFNLVKHLCKYINIHDQYIKYIRRITPVNTTLVGDMQIMEYMDWSSMIANAHIFPHEITHKVVQTLYPKEMDIENPAIYPAPILFLALDKKYDGCFTKCVHTITTDYFNLRSIPSNIDMIFDIQVHGATFANLCILYYTYTRNITIPLVKKDNYFTCPFVTLDNPLELKICASDTISTCIQTDGTRFTCNKIMYRNLIHKLRCDVRINNSAHQTIIGHDKIIWNSNVGTTLLDRSTEKKK